jgi:predicted transcriptional regulator
MQRKFFHTASAKSKGITPAMVKEYDKASKGLDLPNKIKAKKGVKPKAKGK